MYRKLKIKKRLAVKLLSVIFLNSLALSSIVLAAPSSPPGASGYTLEDIYSKYSLGYVVEESSHSFAPEGGPSFTVHSVEYLHDADPYEEPPPGQRLATATGSNREEGLGRDYTVDSINGTVIDHNTGLMWKRCNEGRGGASCSGSASTYTWQNAINQCESLSFAGHSDWRLPEADELLSLVDYAVAAGASINSSVFPNVVQNNTWTDTDFSDTEGWAVTFSREFAQPSLNSSSNYVHCVRSV